MKRNILEAVGATVAWAAIVAAQTTVVGTGDADVDVPAVQAAVDQGGRVILKGHFSFDAAPTVHELPWAQLSEPLGMVLVSKTVAIVGMLDNQDEMPTIEGGNNPFYVAAAGASVEIRGLHFIHSKDVVIRVVAARGLVIADNRIEGVPRDTNVPTGIVISTSTNPPNADSGQPENVTGVLSIANNDIDLQATSSNQGMQVLGVIVWAVGRSLDQEVDLYISGNHITNSNERPINIYSIGGRAFIERNVIKTTGGAGINVTPSGDVIHIVGPGSFLIAHNIIDCQWTSGLQAAIRLQTRPEQPVSHAIVADNDVNMSAPEGTKFGVTSAAIEIRGTGDGNMVLNNRIRGRANFGVSVAGSTPGSADFTGVPQDTVFIMNDLTDFTSAQADVFVDAGATNTIAVGRISTIEDHGAGTVILPAR
jgi:hypothetical protein